MLWQDNNVAQYAKYCEYQLVSLCYFVPYDIRAKMTEVYPFNDALSAGPPSRTLPVLAGMMGCGVSWKTFIF